MTKLKSHKVFSGTEVKSAGSSSYYDLSFYDYLGGSNRSDLRALEAIRLYIECNGQKTIAELGKMMGITGEWTV